MGTGTRYPHVVRLLRRHARTGRALEIGAGGAVYKDLFEDYVGTDLPSTGYQAAGDIAVYCDGRRLPFADASFGTVFTVATLCLIPEPARVCCEAWRCLAPGGCFLVFDYTMRTKRDLQRRHERQADGVQLNFWTGRELQALLRDARFGRVQRHERRPWLSPVTRALPGLGDELFGWLIYQARK